MKEPVIHFYEARMGGATMCGIRVVGLDEDEHTAISRHVTCRKCLDRAGMKPPGRVTVD